MATLAQHHRSGFSSFGEFCAAVRFAAEKNDERLTRVYAAAPATVSQEGSGADGGYAAPPDVRADLASAVLAETSLLGRTDRVTTPRGSISVPVDASPAWAGGPLPTPEPEGALLGEAKTALQARVVRLAKVQVLVPVSNELLEDVVGLDAYLRQLVAPRIDFAVTNWLVNGDGVNKPLGILNSPNLITQTKEGAQAAGTIQAANLTKMWGRLWGPSKSRAVWLAHSSAEQAIQGLSLPPGLLTYPPDSPYGYLFGRPLLLSEACQVVGTPGDLLLVDPKGILSVTKPGEVREDLSVHVWFDLDLSAFRFTLRLGAVPWWGATVTQKNGGGTVSTAVALEAR